MEIVTRPPSCPEVCSVPGALAPPACLCPAPQLLGGAALHSDRLPLWEPGPPLNHRPLSPAFCRAPGLGSCLQRNQEPNRSKFKAGKERQENTNRGVGSVLIPSK
ncbi:hypothetical protein KIL84_001774 [Mauremys mutica]|uniref:Uncharacterized protein n=1 Tax=Mauremys mutica TaxID=74926 RepID=A0A9D4B5C0_9SAUR|nr:hypothetical protein KIL84_001774 [Mauremys mutica]